MVQNLFLILSIHLGCKLSPPPHFTLWRWSLSFAGRGAGRAVRPYVESLALVELEPRFPRMPMTVAYPFSCRVAATLRWYRRRLNDTKRSRGPKINRNKSSGLRLGSWKGVALPGPFSWTDGPFRIFGVWFGPDLQLEKI